MSALTERLLDKVAVAADGCWVWIGTRNKKGYGYIGVNGKPTRVHRAAYEIWVGPIPAGLVIDHLCRNTSCINPDHLEPVTNAENRRRAIALITHCPQGHPYAGENLRLREGDKPGHRPVRLCRACKREISTRSARRRAHAT